MKENNKIYTISVIFSAASLILAVFFIWPLLEEIEKNSQDLVLAKNNIATLEAQTRETGNFKKNYGDYKPNFEKIDQLYIDSNNPVDFIKFLENTALSSKITSHISLPSFSGAENKNFIIFQFSSKGKFLDTQDFLKKIETGPYLIEIENLIIQDLEDKTGAEFTIKAFIKK